MYNVKEYWVLQFQNLKILSYQLFTCPKWPFDRIGNPPTKPGKFVLFANEEFGKTFEEGVGNIVDREG